MLRAIERVFAAAQGDTPAVSAQERRQLQAAVAVLLHEARRADYAEGDDESVAAELALAEIFGLERRESAALLEQGRARAQLQTPDDLERSEILDIPKELPEDYRARIAHREGADAIAVTHLVDNRQDLSERLS